jgi:hypothetical protein
MKAKENDPDTLQIKDELDEEWVAKWKKATSKKASHTNEFTILVPQQVKTHAPILKKRYI